MIRSSRIHFGKKECKMWLLYAAGSDFFAGVTSILAKCGIRKTDSTVATAGRTAVVLVFAWISDMNKKKSRRIWDRFPS